MFSTFLLLIITGCGQSNDSTSSASEGSGNILSDKTLMDKGTAYYSSDGFSGFYPNASDDAYYTFSEGCVKPYKGTYTYSKPVHAYFEIYTDGTVASKHIGADNEAYSTEGTCRVMKKFKKSVSIANTNVTLSYNADFIYYEEASGIYFNVSGGYCGYIRNDFKDTGYKTPLEFETFNNNFIVLYDNNSSTGLCPIDAMYTLIKDYQQ